MKYLLIFLCIPFVLADTYYVDDSATSGSGTIDDPWSLNEGLNALSAGDILFLREGTYTDPLFTPSDGTSSAPITVQTYQGENVIFEIIQEMDITGDHWIFDGFEVNGLDATDDLFSVTGFNVTFRDCNIHSRERDLFDISGDYFTIYGCDVHDTYWYDSFDAHCLVFNQQADYANVSYNNIYNCDGDGIQFFAEDDDNPDTDYSLYAWIAYNTFHADPSYPVPSPNTVVENAIDLKGLSNATIKGNTMYGFPNMKAFVAQKGVSYLVVEENILYDSFAGFEFRGEDGWTQTGHKIYRNVIYDSGEYCLKFDGVFASEVYHNVMDNCTGRAVRMEGGNLIDSFFHNNIAYRSGPPSSNDDSTIKSHNGWFDTDDGGLGGEGDIVGSDPGFIDVGNRNYNLRIDSVAIDAGLDVGLVYGGSAPDLGAFEIISLTCGDGAIDGDEECDDGANNGVVCTASYGDSCQYCSLGCVTTTVLGPFCGDGVCSDGETSMTCSDDCGTIAQLPLIATFSDEEEFSYIDDVFGTNEAARSDGQWVSTGCFAGGCLQVGLNMMSPASSGPYSGGWSREFEVLAPVTVQVSFWYTLRLAEPTEIGEVASMLFKDFDGNDIHIISLEHDNPGQDSFTSGFYTGEFALTPGLYEFIAGCHLTSVSSGSENAECWIDEVSIVGGVNDPDFNDDGVVDVVDFDLLQQGYNTASNSLDLSGDAFVSLIDVALFGSFFEIMPENFKVAFVGDQGVSPDAEAVLQLIADEGADMLLLLGDFGYLETNPEIPQLWEDQMSNILGSDYPAFGVIGNHDVNQWPEYQQLLVDRLARMPGAYCTGDYGVKASCAYKGLFFVLSGVGTMGSDHEAYISSELASSSALWNICAWHKNQEEMQVGGKSSAVGWEAYEICRQEGALIMTGHEHSYQRTHTLSDMVNQVVADTSSPYTITQGQTLAVVSGLGGRNPREQVRCLPTTPPYGCNGEWASIYTSSQNANHGALFCSFNVDGQPEKAHCYFKDTAGVIIDDFELIAS